MQENNYQNQQPQGNPYQQYQENPYQKQHSQNNMNANTNYSNPQSQYNPGQNQANPQFQNQQSKPKNDLVLGNVFKRLFSGNPYSVFELKLDLISIIVLLVAAIGLAGLATFRSMFFLFRYPMYMGGFISFVLSFILSAISMILIYGVMFGYGHLIQGKKLNLKQNSMPILDTLALAVIPSIIFYFFGFLFSFFWSGGWNLFTVSGLVSSIVFFFDGLDLRLGKEKQNYWYKLGMIFIVFAIFYLI